MTRCTNHPEVETRYECMKHRIFLCEDCLRCRDPELYCKFRTACPIWFQEKVAKRRERDKNSQNGPESSLKRAAG